MNEAKLIKVLEKTAKSISAHVMRGNSIHTIRSSELRIRYDDARTDLQDLNLDAWKKYCLDHGYFVDHDSFDLFA